MSYVAFISYKHSLVSRPHAERLEAALKRYSKPLWKPPIGIFRDERVLRPGDDLPATIRKALEQSQFFLYLASKEAAQSEWVQDELRIWCKDLDRADRLLIVHIGDRITTDPTRGAIVWEQTDALPDLMKPFVHSIPIWTDLSWATTDEQRDLNNVDYKKAVNAITARFRGKQPGEMNDEEVLTHRRNVRLRNTAIAIVMLFALLATFFGDQARRERNSAVNANRVAQEQRKLAEDRARKVELAEAFRMVDRGSENFRNGMVSQSKKQFDGAAGLLGRLVLDPMMALHSSLAADTRLLKSKSLVAVEGEVSYVRVSRQGDLVAVIYDYQSPAGNPDIEKIPDNTAVALYQPSTGKWIGKQKVGSAIGRKVYDMYSSEVIGLESPHHLILSRGNEGEKTFLRFSVVDGSETPCDQSACAEYAEAFNRSDSKVVPKELEGVIEPSSLFKVPPRDGIDSEYGSRVVQDLFVTSPDGRTAIVGTYEGRLLLLDLAAGLVRGEEQFSPIFAAAYRQDGKRAFVADGSHLFEVDTSGYRGIRDIPSPLKIETGNSKPEEKALAATLSDDGSLLAIVTTRHLIGLTLPENRWIVWELPREIEKAAALRVDRKRHAIDLVVGDDGTLISGDYHAAASALRTSPARAGKHRTVAWLDADQPVAWLSETTAVDGSVRVRMVSMPGSAGTPKASSIRLRSIEPGNPIDVPPTVHSIARMGDQLVLFHGDPDTFGDREMWNETMTVVSLSGRTPQSDHVVIDVNRWTDNLGEVHWSCTHVEEVLSDSRKERLLGRAGTNLIAVKPDGKVESIGQSLSWRDYADQDQAYALDVAVIKEDPYLTIKHLGSGTVVQHQVPWSFKAKPGLAMIGPKGRQIVVVSTKGDVVVVDAAAFAAQGTALAAK